MNLLEEIKDCGNGWYKTSDGESFQSKTAAMEHQREIQYLDRGVEIAGMHVEVKKWKSYYNFYCPIEGCKDSRLGEKKIRRHIVEEHSSAELDEKRIVETDRFGNVIEE